MVLVVGAASAAAAVLFMPDDSKDEQVARPPLGGEIDVGEIRIADTDPSAVIEVGSTLMQTDRIVVVLEPGSPRTTADAVATSLGGEVIGVLEYVDLYQIGIPGGDEAQVRTAVSYATTLPGVQSAFADELVTLSEEIWGVRTSPLNDPVYAGSTGGGYRAIGVDKAWQYIRGSGIDPFGVRVGITDTSLWKGGGEFDDAQVKGIDPAKDETAAPLMTKPLGNGWQGQFPQPDGSHATGVATIIAGDAEDGGAVGIASGVLGDRLEVLHANVLDKNLPEFTPANADAGDVTKYTDAVGDTWSVRSLEALLRQVKAGAKVINMSWGCTDCAVAVRNAYERFFQTMAREHPEVVFVASAGNDGTKKEADGTRKVIDGTRRFPSGFALPNVITVGNVNNDGTTNDSSNLSSANYEVTIAAPGNQAVRGIGPDGSVINNETVYGTATRTVNGVQQQLPLRYGGGTSMAAPQVTATVALMKSLDPTLTADEIKKILKDTARQGVPATDGRSVSNLIDEKLGAGLLAVDEAVLAVINRVRASQGMEKITGEQLVSFGVLDAVAVTGKPNEFVVRGIVTGCRGDCTEVSISVSGEHSLGGSAVQSLDAPGDIGWTLKVKGDYPVTVFVKRLDNGAGSRILIDNVPIAGTWSGTLTLTGITIPGEQTLPDGTTVGGGTYEGEAIEQCLTTYSDTVDAAIADAIRQLSEGVPFTAVFTGTEQEPGTVTLSASEGEPMTKPWRVEGTGIVFDFVEDDTYWAFSASRSGSTMTGALGGITEDKIELRGSFTLNRVGD